MGEDAVLVTGGSRGIGRGIVRRLVGDGYRVVVLDRIDPPEPGIARFERVDLADADATRAVLDTLTREMTITRLVNNVGRSTASAIADVDFALMREVVALNLRTAILCVQALLPGMEAAGFGRIVNIGSRVALGKELRTIYGATKGGVHTATRSWASEFGARGITVNAVAPGAIDTELFRENNPPGSPVTEKILASVPAGRLGTPDDVAEAVAFFLGRASGYITGQTLYVCGGLSVGGIAAP